MTRHNLPVQLTTFVGRETELLEISEQLTSPECRLLTLVGPGGIGKTRLALAAAEAQRGNFADGIYFVPLQPLSSANRGRLVYCLGGRLSAAPAPGGC